MERLRSYYVPAIFWLLLCTWLLTLPGEKIPKENIFSQLQADKWVHIILFFIMVVLWCWSASFKKIPAGRLRSIFIFIALLAFAWGTGMEFVQRYLVANRSFDIGDILADGTGCAIGLIFSMKRYIKNKPL